MSGSGDGSAAAPAKLEQSFVAKGPQRAQHRVRVDAKHGGEVSRGRKPIPRRRLAIGDRAPKRCCRLLVKRYWTRMVDRKMTSSAIHNTTISCARLDFPSPPGQRDDRSAHSLLMNGGLSHSLEVNYAQAGRAAEGFRFLGAEELRQLVDQACSTGAPFAQEHDRNEDDLTDEQEDRLLELERRYSELVPSDSRLVELFRAYLAEHPEQFTPIR
jgi:hypothetical protein